MKGFPTRSPSDLEHRPQEQQWLVDGLWGRQAVGIIGGEPKCGKSFLALDLAVAVAAGVPCLRRFEADQPGPVLMFAAEGAGHIVLTRLQGIARAAGADFETLDIAVIDVPALRLDHRNDRQRLQETIERIEPRLLVLDPLVRLHGVDENAVADIAPILGFLRDLQRRFETAVLLVHHARKSGATRPGQALRGSSELHAWGDSNLYPVRLPLSILALAFGRRCRTDPVLRGPADGLAPGRALRALMRDSANRECGRCRRRRPPPHDGPVPPLHAGELRGAAASRQQPLAVAVDHGGALPAPRLLDRRQLDAVRDHAQRARSPADPAVCPRRRRPAVRQGSRGGAGGRAGGGRGGWRRGACLRRLQRRRGAQHPGPAAPAGTAGEHPDARRPAASPPAGGRLSALRPPEGGRPWSVMRCWR